MALPSQSPFRAVVFDLDGTLLDTLPVVLRAHHHGIAPFHPPMTDAQMLARFGGPPARTMLELLGDPVKAELALRRIEQHWTEHAAESAPFAGLERSLADLRARGLALGLWTGRDRASTEELLRVHALAEVFTVILCGDDLPSHKPDPAGLQEVLRQLAVSAAETLYVGDADADVLGGAAAGVRTLFIRHAREVAPEVATLAWRVVENPVEAFAVIAQETGG